MVISVTSFENHEKYKNGSAEIKSYQSVQFKKRIWCLNKIYFVSFPRFFFSTKECEQGALIVITVTLELPSTF